MISSLRKVKSTIEKQFPQNTEVLNQAVGRWSQIEHTSECEQFTVILSVRFMQ